MRKQYELAQGLWTILADEMAFDISVFPGGIITALICERA